MRNQILAYASIYEAVIENVLNTYYSDTDEFDCLIHHTIPTKISIPQDKQKILQDTLLHDGKVIVPFYYARKKKVKGALPMGCILTLAATGSEMSNSSVITNEDGNLKRGLSSEYGYFKFSILNPELTYTVSKYQTMCGCTDIIMHILRLMIL